MDDLESGPGPGDDSIEHRPGLVGTFALLPRGWISRLKKDHDLEI